jgi:hypothetical protein
VVRKLKTKNAKRKIAAQKSKLMRDAKKWNPLFDFEL